ncbi:MAG: ATP-binding protein [Dehalococcoidia bacterium]|nr:ATP-binding protein [Dehalococcoidia bacterium]
MSQDLSPAQPIGRVLGTDEATPLEFWVAVNPDRYLQLDDVVALERELPNGPTVRMFGVVSQVRARHEGARFDSDVFLIADGKLPAGVSEAAKILATRFEPEVFVPPQPGTEVRRAEGEERDKALFFDGMKYRLPVGLSRDGDPLFANFEFLDGTRGAHVNISGVSGVATKTTYATFLLYSLFHSGLLHETNRGPNSTQAIIFNVKGEDLLFLDHENRVLTDEDRARYNTLGLPAGAFESVEFWAPPRRGDRNAVPWVSSRDSGVGAFFWSIFDFCREDLLPYLFADAEDDRAQYPIVIHNVMAQLRRCSDGGEGGARFEADELGPGTTIRDFASLVHHIEARVHHEDTRDQWAGSAIGQGTINAFIRRLHGAVRHLDAVIRGDIPNPEAHRIRRQKQLTVVDLHNLNDRAQRFVVGAVLREAFNAKEDAGGDGLLFVVLDELNKYAPREGSSPIKEILLDIAERGRSLGIILIGAQQTASEVERRVVANSAIRVVGRLDSAESGREEYGFLPPVHRQRATIIKPGTMILSQPELPVPIVLEFPFPAWATRPNEAVPKPAAPVLPGGNSSENPLVNWLKD